MKTYLTALLSFLIAPALTFAALDVNLSGSSVISVGGYSLVVSGSANIDSISVDTSSFSVQLSPGATLTVTSSDRKSFTVSPSIYTTSYTTSQTCNASQSSVMIAMASGGPVDTVTITPNSTDCTLPGSGGGGGGGGGTTTTTSSSSSKTASITASSASATSIIPAAKPASPVFNKNLSRGSKGEDVSNLQRLLAQDKAIYPEGIVSGVFGPMTEIAVKKFQAKYNLPQVGRVGPATREILNIVASASPSATIQSSSQGSSAVSQSASSFSSSVSVGIINKRLQKGMTDDQISTLQQWLSQDKEIYPDAIISGYYGSLTEKAVQKFQEKYGIVKAGEEGYGIVGPKTRAKLSEIFGGNSSSAQ